MCSKSIDNDSIEIYKNIKYDNNTKSIVIPIDIKILKSLLSRAESMVLLDIGCVNNNNASKDEFLTSLGIEVRDRLLKLFKDRISEEKIMHNFRSSCCKLFMESLEK